MAPQIVKDKPGRPPVGTESKSNTIKFRIEPTLYAELKFACRTAGVPIAQGIRMGIILFIRHVTKRYYQ